MESKIYIVTHKETELPSVEGYKPLLVGAYRHDSVPASYLADNTGDNISEYNDSYCELTGLYWMWKNVDSDIIGLAHYRRYFADVKAFDYKAKYLVLSKKNRYKILSLADAVKLLDSCDLIVKKSKVWRDRTNYQMFAGMLTEDFVKLMTDSIAGLYPEYIKTLEEYFLLHYHVNCNMFIGKKEVMDRYCKWLFDILGETDRRYKELHGDRCHGRELGYLGELLFGVWLTYNKIDYVFHRAINTMEFDISHPDKTENVLMTPMELIKLKKVLRGK
ncbi:MAG: DUF4422 domain-containing protein [Saccharofermentans sp.]|nr:DUF4422 domain-containing protein [Saccharofermentans sp.]